MKNPSGKAAGNPSFAAAARKIVADMKEAYGAPQALTRVDEKAFPHLKLAKYAKFRAFMEARGFRWLADYEIKAMSQSKTSLLAPTMIRAMASADGRMVIGYFQVMPRMGRRIRLLLAGLLNLRLLDAPRDFAANLGRKHMMDVATEFDDGSFLVTSNGGAAAFITQPASIESHFLPDTKLPDVLLKEHARRLDEIERAGGRRAVPVRTEQDAERMHLRLAAQKAAWRTAHDWITRDELYAMSGGNAALADGVHAEVQRLVAAERRPPG